MQKLKCMLRLCDRYRGQADLVENLDRWSSRVRQTLAVNEKILRHCESFLKGIFRTFDGTSLFATMTVVDGKANQTYFIDHRTKFYILFGSDDILINTVCYGREVERKSLTVVYESGLENVFEWLKTVMDNYHAKRFQSSTSQS